MHAPDQLPQRPVEPLYQGERRPLASRDKRLAKAAAHWLVARRISPNAISVAGMMAGLAAGGALAATSLDAGSRVAFIVAALLIQLRLLANMLDGMVAVEAGVASPVGELYNEVPDRVSDAAAFIGAGYALGSKPELGYLAACAALLVAYIRAQGRVAGAHQEYCGPLAKPQRMFLLTLLSLWCGLTPAFLLPAHQPGQWGVMAWGLAALIAGMGFTALRRLARIARALRSRPA